MGIALFTFDGLLAPLQVALDWFAGATRRPVQAPRFTQAPHPAPGLGCIRAAAPVRAARVRRLSAGPVRVLRVVDGHAPATAGRMVISGRMADVCAELDRLASHEATLRRSPPQRGGLPTR